MDENTKAVKPEKKVSSAELKKQIEQLTAEVADYKDKWTRNVAEFDNYKKRNAKLWQEAYTDGTFDAVKKLLPIGDSLDWAVNMGLDPKTEEGIRGLIKKFSEALGSLGIEEINPVGKPFDFNEAEAIMQVEKGEGEESDCVKQVFEKGYRTKDKVLRYAKVSVTK